MLDVRGGHGLSLEACDHLGEPTHLGMEDFDGHALVHVRVLGLIDRAHAALADQPFDEVAPTEHGSDERLGAAGPRAWPFSLGRRSFGRLGHAYGFCGGVTLAGRCAHRQDSHAA